MGIYYDRTYDFKAKDCDELANIDIPFAIKEYVQNSVGQILKALHRKTWREWKVNDFSEETEDNVTNRKKFKTALVEKEGQLFAGKQGQYIAKCVSIQPCYVLAAEIPRSEIVDQSCRAHDLRVIIVLWKAGDGTALTIYNNHLDLNTRFEHFVYDGASTSKDSEWAVGLKGKGFIIATALLAQECDTYTGRSINSNHVGIGFNVGSRLCRASYNEEHPNMLQVKREDLRPLTLDEFRKENPYWQVRDVDLYGSRAQKHKREPDEWYRKKLESTFLQRKMMGLARQASEEGSIATASLHEIAIVKDDDVCIHVVGLPASLSKEEAFSGVYGIVRQPAAWTSADKKFEIFEADRVFYHRDQLVPIEGPLKTLGVNYHGHLRLTADRTEIVQNTREFREYQVRLRECLQAAMGTSSKIAACIMQDFFMAFNSRYMPSPQSEDYAEQYRVAFQAAARIQYPSLVNGDQLAFPYHLHRPEDKGLVQELGFVPLPLADWQMKILEDSGAYQSIIKLSEEKLVKSERVLDREVPGMELFKKCLCQLAPKVGNTFVVNYTHSRPQCVHHDGDLFLAKPKPCGCDRRCLCWVGPTLVQVLKCLKKGGEDVDLYRVFRVYDQERGLKDMPEEAPARRNTTTMPESPSVGRNGYSRRSDYRRVPPYTSFSLTSGSQPPYATSDAGSPAPATGTNSTHVPAANIPPHMMAGNNIQNDVPPSSASVSISPSPPFIDLIDDDDEFDIPLIINSKSPTKNGRNEDRKRLLPQNFFFNHGKTPESLLAYVKEAVSTMRASPSWETSIDATVRESLNSIRHIASMTSSLRSGVPDAKREGETEAEARGDMVSKRKRKRTELEME